MAPPGIQQGCNRRDGQCHQILGLIWDIDWGGRGKVGISLDIIRHRDSRNPNQSVEKTPTEIVRRLDCILRTISPFVRFYLLGDLLILVPRPTAPPKFTLWDLLIEEETILLSIYFNVTYSPLHHS